LGPAIGPLHPKKKIFLIIRCDLSLVASHEAGVSNTCCIKYDDESWGVLLVCIKMGTSATTTCINKILRTTGLKLTSLFCELKAKLRVIAQDKTRTYVNDATAVRTQNSQFPEAKL